MHTLKVKITLLDEMLGTSSGDKDIHKAFIASKAPDAPNRNEKITEEIEAVGLAEATEKTMTVFPKDENGTPFIWNYQIKGFFKDACSALQRCKDEDWSKESCAIKAFKKIIDGCIFPEPRKIKIDMHGGEMGVCQRPLRANTMHGEQNALASSETVPEGSTMEFTVVCLSKKYIPTVKEWLNYGRFKGLLQWRNSGKGRFSYEIIEENHD